MLSKPTSEQRRDDKPTGSEEHDDVVVDVVDALTLNREVQWERCEKLATPANRRALRNLRALARLVSAREPAPETSLAAGADTRDRPFVRRASQVLIAIAAVEVAAALMLLPWAWGDYQREHGELAVYFAIKLVGHSASACLLLFAGRRDRRTWLLGIYCLLKATEPQLHMLPAFLLELPPPEQLSAHLLDLPASSRLFLYFYVPSFMFSPVFLWAFARECPRVQYRARLDDVARCMVPASVAIGFALWVGCGVTLQLAQAGYAEALVPVVMDGSVAARDLLSLAAVVVVALRAHTAQAEEVRRVVVFSIGFLMYMGLVAAYDLAEAFAPGNWGTNYRRSPAVLAMEVMRFPGMVLLWYSVLAARVPHVREVVGAGCRRLLTRPGPLQAAVAAPALGLAWLMASRPERTVGALLADPAAQSLFAVAGILLLAALGRGPILRRVDAWTHPEAADQQQALAAATAALAQTGSIRRVTRAVTRAAKRGCGSPAVLVAAIDLDTHARTLHAPDATLLLENARRFRSPVRWPTPSRPCTTRGTCTGTSSRAISASRPPGLRNCWTLVWPASRTTPPWWAAPCATRRPRSSPAARPRRPTTSGRWPWSSTRWSRDTIPSPAQEPTRTRSHSTFGADASASMARSRIQPGNPPWPPSRRRYCPLRGPCVRRPHATSPALFALQLQRAYRLFSEI